MERRPQRLQRDPPGEGPQDRRSPREYAVKETGQMAGKNKKPEYINKLLQIRTPGGYRFDIANYLSNPAYGYEYPRFMRIVEADADRDRVEEIAYIKHYNGTGEYVRETWTKPKRKPGDPKTTCYIVRDMKTETLEACNRFSLDKLISYCNA
jgi:hypothetical protein